MPEVAVKVLFTKIDIFKTCTMFLIILNEDNARDSLTLEEEVIKGIFDDKFVNLTNFGFW